LRDDATDFIRVVLSISTSDSWIRHRRGKWKFRDHAAEAGGVERTEEVKWARWKFRDHAAEAGDVPKSILDNCSYPLLRGSF